MGSTGKKNPGGSSGDIDLAVDFRGILNDDITDIKEVLVYLKSVADKISDTTALNIGISEVHFAYPIANVDGKQENEFVQVDLMPTDNLEYTKFTYHSPAEWESKYKGLHRNILMFSILSATTTEVLETGVNKNGEEVPAKIRKKVYNMNKGIQKVVRSFVGKKGNIVKTGKNIERQMVTNNVQEIVNIMVGPEYKPKDLKTYDQLIKIVQSPTFIHKEHRDKILKSTAESLQKLGVLLPPELKEYL
jgi:hypothetical protein